MTVHPIEVESYRRMHAEVDFSAWTEPRRSIVARMVHGTADPLFAVTALVGERVVAAGISALRAGAAVIADAEMVRAGMPGAGARCFLAEVPAIPVAPTAPTAPTRSAAAITLAAAAHPRGAIWVIGNAPTALAELLRLHADGEVEPAAVVGLPVGWVGATEAKAALWDSPLRAISVTNQGRRGGSAVAASAFNALVRLARAEGGEVSGLPVVLDVARRRCLVVGAGRAARWKLDALTAAGAAVTVIAPQVRHDIAATAQLTLLARRVRPGDTASFGLVVVATDDPAVNDAVAREAQANGALVLRADGAEGDLRLPAVHRLGHLSIAVDTDGTSPTLARWMRDRLAAGIPPVWATLAAWAAATRPRTGAEIDHHLAELQR